MQKAKLVSYWKNTSDNAIIRSFIDYSGAAIKQINEKMYANEFEDAYDEILCYGISFFKKRCLVKKNRK